MTDLEKGLELERLEYMGEIEIRRAALEERIRQVKADHARRGILQSGGTTRAIDEARSAYCTDLIMTRIAILGIPAKLNASSGGMPNGIPG